MALPTCSSVRLQDSILEQNPQKQGRDRRWIPASLSDG